MSDNKNINVSPEGDQLDFTETNLASISEVSSVVGSVKTSHRVSSSSERQIKFERAQKCLENAALVSKRIKEHRKATAELLGKPFEEDDYGDTASEMASTMSEKTGFSTATDTSTTLSVQEALNIPGISESLANTLKQKELLMERIKQYKEISKRPLVKPTPNTRKELPSIDKKDSTMSTDNSNIVQLVNTIKEKENTLSVIQVKMKAMETTILELQEKINEKDQIIEAKNRATILMSDNLSKKEKDSMNLLEDTKQQMIKMQENFLSMETEWKQEKENLCKEINAKTEKIKNLEEANNILENRYSEVTLANSKVSEELEAKNKEITKLQELLSEMSKPQIEDPQEKNMEEQEKGSLEISSMVELSKKVELLEQLNCQIRQTNKELEIKLASTNSELKPINISPSKIKGSPLPTRKGGRNTGNKSKSPWNNLSADTGTPDIEKKSNKNEVMKLELLIQSLNKDILEKEYVISQKDALIIDLQSKNENIELSKSIVEKQDVSISTDPTFLLPENKLQSSADGSLAYDISKELEVKLNSAHEQIVLLNDEIEASNKNMIKVKSNHKLKLKQLQKTIDNFSKVSDTNAEMIKLNEEIHQLSQKVAELEEEKGNLQLHLVDYDSGRLTESEIYRKMVEMENLAETRLKAINLLETQKFDLVQELHNLQQINLEIEDKLADISQLQNEHVCSEMKSVQLEEHIDKLTASLKELQLVVENLKLDKEHLNGMIKLLKEEKHELVQKLDNYIQENIDLTDKLEKLSAEKVSSAESIEIVESLTVQEKLELEEYNKGIVDSTVTEQQTKNVQKEKNIDDLFGQSIELQKKIELFTQEREEVMEKMTILNEENESLHNNISELNSHNNDLLNKIQLLTNEKENLEQLNTDLVRQIEELKRERLEIIKDTVDITKSITEETVEGLVIESHSDEKSLEKGLNRNKSVKQLTKEILKLKNTIKEREAEIGDCQMKILSLEETQQKQNELTKNNVSFENKIKLLTDENNSLRDQIERLKISEQELIHYKHANELLQQDINKIHHEHSEHIKFRDSKIIELENLLLEYEKQMFNYNNTLQQKDKEINEFINQITKLNDVSQKLKSTIELLEDEKARDQNTELVKSLNKQITVFQKTLVESEEKLRILEEEKIKLISEKNSMEHKISSLDTEITGLQENLTEKLALIKDLQTSQLKQSEELSTVLLQTKERDEEIHEIKLQLRKESIENEKLRTALSEKAHDIEALTQQFENSKAQLEANFTNSTHLLKKKYDESVEQLNTKLIETKQHVDQFSLDKNTQSENFLALENKNKELMEKLKKFALNIKKKSALYAELETNYNETQQQLQLKNEQIEQLLIQVEALPSLQEKIKYAEDEINRLQSQKVAYEQANEANSQLRSKIKTLNDNLLVTTEELAKVTNSYNELNKEYMIICEENLNLKGQVDSLSNKLVEHEIEQKNNFNLLTKISTLEADINTKQNFITEILNKLEQHEQHETQTQFGHEAKLQERDLYIESLETEINKYKNRICRLEEIISTMEDRRHSLERKADQLDIQLQEKQKAYSEYTNQEDELVNRLAVLMDHDRVLEKQVHEIEIENKELQHKLQYFIEDNQQLKSSLAVFQEQNNILLDKANKYDLAESELSKSQSQLHDVESRLKHMTHEHKILQAQGKQDIEEIESEFNTQIENVIKEKKTLSEKYEKLNEHVSLLEDKLLEYRNNIENLNLTVEELNKVNHELTEKSSNTKYTEKQDYTEQYIVEINRLNKLLNSKNEEASELNNMMQVKTMNNITIISNLEAKILDLTEKLQKNTFELEHVVQEFEIMKRNSDQLKFVLSQKEEQIKELIEKKSLSFEMTIPKTEGMIISSTIEPLSNEQKSDVISDLESQIVTDTDSNDKIISREAKNTSKASPKQLDQGNYEETVVEPVIVPKKTYLCYKKDEDSCSKEADPFNSDEGWGFGENEGIEEVPPGVFTISDQLEQLKKENDKLKNDLEASNNKLLKALKKLKELKANNDALTNEIKITKQISSSSFLDTAIEDELRLNIQQLEKQLEEVNIDLNKEKREKEALKKQNEVFNNANDRLTEMKEKLENEIELWRYKFKDANDKISSLRWDAESKGSPMHVRDISVKCSGDAHFKEEMLKIEKENDEMQLLIDQLTTHNKELSSRKALLETEILDLKGKLKSIQLNDQMTELTDLNARLQNYLQVNSELLKNKETLTDQIRDLEIRYSKTSQNYESLKIEHEKIVENLENKLKESVNINEKLEIEIGNYKEINFEADNKITSLTSELECVKEKIMLLEKDRLVSDTKLDEDCDTLKYKLSALEVSISDLNSELNESREHINQLENTKKDLINQINDFNTKVQHLNTENDNLLSTVAELRSSVSSAVDQRGFEIAELWKQHLAQREADFQNIESELRSQVASAEAKYEQLLDNVQSSSQEETNKLIVIEQINSLQSKLQDKEDHLLNLQDKYAEVVNQLDLLRSEMEDEKISHGNKFLEQQEEYEKVIQDLRSKLQEMSESYEDALKKVQSELLTLTASNKDIVLQNDDLKNKITVLETTITDLQNVLRTKEAEIYQKTQEFTISLTQRNEEFENVRKLMLDYEKKIEDLSYEKESELAVLRLKQHEYRSDVEKRLEELELAKTSLTTDLNDKILECNSLNKQIIYLNRTLEEESTKGKEMQLALENQEFEIVTLKDEISKLQEMLNTSHKITKHVSFASDTKPSSDGDESDDNMLNKDLLDAVPRAELDLALYMLHQRDVRCEELTMELTQLLDERDTLQLRLSDCLRSNEELKAKCKIAGIDSIIDSSQETISDLPSFTVEKEFVDIHRGQTSRSSSISDPDGDKPKLQAKLSELRSVRHSRDVRLRQESEQRQMDLRLLQRDVALLPPEAVNQLNQAHHTLSRDSQSTPTVLLNWLRGKSTPKVVHM